MSRVLKGGAMSGRRGLSRRRFLLAGVAATQAAPALIGRAASRRPNILFAIADDQSWVSTGIHGDPVARTPAFDRLARQGVLFRNAFCASPGCAPSRAALLTGRHHWQLEEAGTHASLFPAKFRTYPQILQEAGYFVGLTGKGAGPCNWKDGGWKHNPAGPSFDSRTALLHFRATRPIREGISSNDYAANFEDFLRQKPPDMPFCFWFGCQEPHRGYQKGSGVQSGRRLQDARVPPFLPDTEEVRGDLLDYSAEIEHFDTHLGRVLRTLEEAGELSNTLVIVTADNGMSFPRAKANLYEYGIHVPLAVAWGARITPARTVDDLVGFVDLAPTMLEAAGVQVPREMSGRSLLGILSSEASGLVEPGRTRVFSGRERHSHSRFDNLGYPCRAMRTPEYLFILNFKPDRWPAGDPEGFHDIDAAPSKQYMLEHRSAGEDVRLFELSCGKRPAEELYDVRKDPGCLVNLAASPQHRGTVRKLRAELERVLTEARDPRMLGAGDTFESYPRFSPMRPELGGFAREGAYNPKYRPGNQ
jgi:uncharacterized sulfatase